MQIKKIVIFFFSLFISAPALANSLKLISADISEGNLMTTTHEFNGFGCKGDDLSPQLSWSGAPSETKSFAITVYDPDAPTGSGWWHWQVINIPASISNLDQGAGKTEKGNMPIGSMQIINDYGIRGFGGTCPPKGHGVHRYQFTIHALSVEKLDMPENASGALAGYMINANSIASHTLEALYKRD